MPLISLYGRFKGVYKIILQPVAERLDIPPHKAAFVGIIC